MSEAKRYEGPITVGMRCWVGSKQGEPDRVVDRYDPALPWPVRYTASSRNGGDNEATFRVRFAVIEPADIPAESPVAPVERVLSGGWAVVAPEECAAKFAKDCGGPAIYRFSGQRYPYCEIHAAGKGAFATPAPTVPMKHPGCADWCGGLNRACGGSNGCQGVGDGPCVCPNLIHSATKSTPVTTPKPAPRCEYMDGNCGSVERLAVRVVGKYQPMLVCEQCYLGHERHVAGRNNLLDGAWHTDNRPRANVGVVPQVYGLSVGILSRGMAK